MEESKDVRYLKHHLATLQDFRERMIRQVAQLTDEMTQIETRIMELEQQLPEPESNQLENEFRLAYGSLRGAILSRLAREPGGMATTEIGKMLSERFGASVHPKSHYSALRRLESEGLVEKQGRSWLMRSTFVPSPRNEAPNLAKAKSQHKDE